MNQHLAQIDLGTTGASSFASNVIGLGRRPDRLLIGEVHGHWRDPVLRRLEEIVGLESGWDGYNGISVNFGNAVFALRMLEVVCKATTPPPQIVPGPSGDLQIEWHLEGGDIELHVEGPNRVVAWKNDGETGQDGEEIRLTNNFAIIANWINNLCDNCHDAIATPAHR